MIPASARSFLNLGSDDIAGGVGGVIQIERDAVGISGSRQQFLGLFQIATLGLGWIDTDDADRDDARSAGSVAVQDGLGDPFVINRIGHRLTDFLFAHHIEQLGALQFGQFRRIFGLDLIWAQIRHRQVVFVERLIDGKVYRDWLSPAPPDLFAEYRSYPHRLFPASAVGWWGQKRG